MDRNDGIDGEAFRRSRFGRQAMDEASDMPPLSSSTCKSAFSNSRRGSCDRGLVRTSSIRNKVRYEESVQKIREIQLRLERASQHSPSPIAAHQDMLEQSKEIFQLLSNLQESNAQNESTIQHLQRQLIELTNERDAARRDAQISKKHEATYCAEWEHKICKERKAFAKLTHKYNKEILKWKRKVNKLGRRNRQLEYEAKDRNKSTGKCEERSAGEKTDNSNLELGKSAEDLDVLFESIGTQEEWPTMQCSKIVISDEIHDEIRACSQKLLHFAEERSSDRSGQQLTAATSSSRTSLSSRTSSGSAHDILHEQIDQFMQSANKQLLLLDNLPSPPKAVAGDDKEAAGFECAYSCKIDSQDIEVLRQASTGPEERMAHPSLSSNNAMKEFLGLACDISEKMKDFAQHHEFQVKDYEEKLAMVSCELVQAVTLKEELSVAFDSLREEREILGAALEESNETDEYYEQMIVESNTELKRHVRRLSLERDEAYDTCNILQSEIDHLRQIRGRPEKTAEQQQRDDVSPSSLAAF